MKCSWAHCEAHFEGQVPSGWKLVARQKNLGGLEGQVVVCPAHCRELLDEDLRLMVRLARGSEDVPVLSDTDEAPVEETRRHGPGSLK